MVTHGNMARKRKQKKLSNRFAPYRYRNLALRKIGFESYADYLNSPLWREIRQKVLDKSRECYVCGGAATQCHHASYSRRVLKGLKLDRIFPICRFCHQQIEFCDRTKTKLNPDQATHKMRSLRARRFQQLRSAASK